MKLILLLLLVILDGAAYYEYTWQQQTSIGFKQQLADWQNKIDTVQSENDKLKSKDASLDNEIAETKQEVLYLADKLTAIRGTTVEEQKSDALGVHAPDSPDLGTITTLRGKTFDKCELLKVQSDGITISCAEGITKILFAYLPPTFQKKFGYDPQKAVLVNEANIHFQEAAQRAEPASASQ